LGIDTALQDPVREPAHSERAVPRSPAAKWLAPNDRTSGTDVIHRIVGEGERHSGRGQPFAWTFICNNIEILLKGPLLQIEPHG
jgi:hypothetical protein